MTAMRVHSQSPVRFVYIEKQDELRSAPRDRHMAIASSCPRCEALPGRRCKGLREREVHIERMEMFS